MPGRITEGEVLLHDDDRILDLLQQSSKSLENIRGNKISMIFQDPMTSLNPVLTIGYQLMEPLMIHRGMSEDDARKEAIRLLDRVGISEAALRINEYPHQFSGGMRQRVMVAMAVACRPHLLIADEPTTALDVTIQAQIIDLINELQRETGTSVIIITHDLGVVAELANHVAVMYAGHIVEIGRVGDIFEAPQHPYTKALMGSIPRLRSWPERLTTIEGAPPSLTDEIVGCPFHPRCSERFSRCETERPLLLATKEGHSCACWVAQGMGEGVGKYGR